MRCLRLPFAAALLLLLWPWPVRAAEATGPNLVILAETGMVRDGLPVYVLHPDPGRIVRVLSRGFSGRLLRLYQFEQEYLHRASRTQPEPAYLLLSGQQGGFPRFGFYLDSQEKRGVGYVDLHRSKQPAGRFGTMDQIFPHELAHIIVRQMTGKPDQGGSNQIHAIGVRTDPYQAFQEGFAEHMQVAAIDDPDADPATRALVSDEGYQKLAERQAFNYRRDLLARWWLPGPTRMGFVIWYSGIEQAWRYFAVKANAFARADALPEGMLATQDPYLAYLLQNTLPGSPQAAPKPASILLSTEGVVSSLFYRWASNESIGQRYRDDEFYARFGTTRAQVTPLENSYLKLFHALYAKKPMTTAAVIEGYKSVFPDESPLIDTLVRDVFLGQPLPSTPAVWLANRDFQTGTSLFDQFRSMPRTHTFDLNAATLVDLMSIPGVDGATAALILKNAPYAGLSDLRRVPGLSPDLHARFAKMAKQMERFGGGSEENESGLSLSTLLMSYLWRALGIWMLAAAAGALLYRRVRPCGRIRAAINGAAASILLLALAWMTTGTAAHIALAAPVVIFGLPAAFWQAIRRRGLAQTIRVFLAWICAAIPAVALAYPWL